MSTATTRCTKYAALFYPVFLFSLSVPLPSTAGQSCRILPEDRSCSVTLTTTPDSPNITYWLTPRKSCSDGPLPATVIIRRLSDGVVIHENRRFLVRGCEIGHTPSVCVGGPNTTVQVQAYKANPDSKRYVELTAYDESRSCDN